MSAGKWKPPDDQTSAPPKDPSGGVDEWEEYTQNTRLRMESQRMREVQSEVTHLQSRYQKLDREVVRIGEQIGNLGERVSAIPQAIGREMDLKIESAAQRLRLWVYGGVVATVLAVGLALLSLLVRK